MDQGENVTQAKFGVVPIDPPPTVEAINIVHDITDPGQVDAIDIVFSEAIHIPVTITEAWIGSALSLVRLEDGGVETDITLTASQVSYYSST